MKTLVVLPTYNESATIAATLRAVHAVLPAAEILVVDASSPDGTERVARAAAAELAVVSVLSCPSQSGRGLACRDGFRWGLARGFEALVDVDPDFARQVTALPVLLAPLAEGWDLVIGSPHLTRGIAAGSLRERLLAGLGRCVAQGPLGRVWTNLADRSPHDAADDGGVGLRAYRADLIMRIGLEELPTGGHGFRLALVERARHCGARVAEIQASLPTGPDLAAAGR